MREIFLTVKADGSIETSETCLGFADEHNATVLCAEISNNAVLTAADYCRFVFDDYISEPYKLSDGTELRFSLPQCVMVPPTVNCQICGYVKNNDGDYDYIGKSGTVTFTVSPSQTGGNEVGKHAADNFEKAISDCEAILKEVQSAYDDTVTVQKHCEDTLTEVLISYEDTVSVQKLTEDFSREAVAAAIESAASKDDAIEAATEADKSATNAEFYKDTAERYCDEMKSLSGNLCTKDELTSSLSAKADKLGDFTLLYNLTTDEATTSITIGEDSDKNEFRLLDAYLKLKIPKSSATANLSIIAHPSASNNTWLDRVMVTNAIQSTIDSKFILARLRFEGGFIFSEASSGNVASGAMTSHSSSFSAVLKEANRGKEIGAITITANENIPVGTVIELWGRR